MVELKYDIIIIMNLNSISDVIKRKMDVSFQNSFDRIKTCVSKHLIIKNDICHKSKYLENKVHAI